MDVSETLKKAWEAVQEAGLPDEIREVAFREAVRLLAPTPIHVDKPEAARLASGEGTRGTESSGDPNGRSGLKLSEAQMYDLVVQHTGVDRDKLEHIVHLSDDSPRVSMAGIKLGRNNAERARTVAQILTITRGFALGENETSLEVIRAECDRLKVYDSANFSSHMKALTGYVINGTGQNRRLRAKGPGVTAFPRLVDELLGVE